MTSGLALLTTFVRRAFFEDLCQEMGKAQSSLLRENQEGPSLHPGRRAGGV
jgi:hypothetical protein